MTSNIMKNLVRVFLGFEIFLILIASGIKWLIYRIYVANPCLGRHFSAHWKAVVFCVNKEELNMWHNIDTILILFVIIFVITIIGAKCFTYMVKH